MMPDAVAGRPRTNESVSRKILRSRRIACKEQGEPVHCLVMALVDVSKRVHAVDEDTSNGSKGYAGTARGSLMDNANVAGLYLATTRQLRFNPFGAPGSASWEVATEFYLLSHDGQVFRGRDLPNAPAGDIGRFDYAAARREAPGNYGTYAVRSTEVVMQFGDLPHETISATRAEPDVLEIRGTKFKRSVPERSVT